VLLVSTARRAQPHTAREVLERHLGGDAKDTVRAILADLATVLTTAGVYRSREITADLLRTGDVITDKRGRLWAVTSIADDGQPAVIATVTRGEVNRAHTFDPWHPVPTLLAADDERALKVLERQLGAKVIGRSAQ